MKWTIAAVLVLLFAVVLVVGIASLSGVPVEAARATRGDIRQFVDERGETRLPEVHLITMPFAGRLEKIELEVGDRVGTDKPVARIVPKDLQDEVDEAEAAVARLDASITEKGNLDLERDVRRQAEIAVAAAMNRTRASLEQAKFAETFLAKMRRLYQQNARSEEDVERAEVDEVESRVRVAEDQLIVDMMRILPEIVDRYMDDQQRQKLTLEEEKAEAEARLRQVITKQQRGQMFSPVAGTVLEKHVENERHLPAGEVLLEIGEFSRMEVEADILSQDVVDVKPGQPVEIYGPAVDARVGEGVPGIVKQVYPAGFTKVSSLGVEEQRVKVVIEMAPDVLQRVLKQHELGVGYRVRVRIFTAQSNGTLTVPRSAVFRGADGGWQLFVIRGGRARRVAVQVGLMNDQRVEILQGVGENESVVLAPETRLMDGARVAVQNQ